MVWLGILVAILLVPVLIIGGIAMSITKLLANKSERVTHECLQRMLHRANVKMDAKPIYDLTNRQRQSLNDLVDQTAQEIDETRVGGVAFIAGAAVGAGGMAAILLLVF